MNTYTAIPDNPTEVCAIMRQHADRERSRLAVRRVRWALAQAYLAGYRRFDALDMQQGKIASFYLEKDGKIPLAIQDMLKQVNDAQGILQSLDLRPLIRRTGLSLNAIRERAMAQLIANAVIDDSHLRDVQSTAANFFMALGHVGISCEVLDGPAVGLTTEFEVIPPSELYPFPSVGTDRSKVCGLMRERLLPAEFLKTKYPFGDDALRKMDVFERVVGEDVRDDGVEAAEKGKPDKVKTTYLLVRVRELWLDGPRGTCSRYIVTSNDHLFADQKFDGEQVYCGTRHARCFDTGEFHGAGLFDLLFGAVREFEKLVKDLINNVRDLDRYPLTVLPAGAVHERTAFKDSGRGLRYISLEMEPTFAGQGEFRPHNIPIHNAGDVPGRTAAFLQQVISGLSPLRDLVKEKGRGDSAAFMQFLDEENKRPMTVPVSNFTLMFSEAYRSAVSTAARKMLTSRRAIPLSHLDLGLLGAVIDWQNGEVSFAQNILPDVSRLDFGIREGNPKRESLRKQEALLLLERGFPPNRFILLALEEGLDFATWLRPEEAAYRTVVMNCLTLFNDGETPGLVWLTPSTENAALQLEVVKAILSGPELRTASVDVVNAFISYKETLDSYMGMVLPEQVPDPYDQAMIQAAAQGKLPPPAAA